MKLRIKGSSIRLRLTEPEVRTLAAEGVLEEAVRFPDATTWRYRLEKASNGAARAGLDGPCLCVALPARQIAEWAASDLVGMDASMSLPSGGTLTILVEKDFECLHPRTGESNTGTYPHPAKGSAR